MKLPAVLRRTDPVDALNAQVARADEDGRDALVRIDALTAERNALLIDGSDEDVARVEAEMDRAQRNLDRAKARRTEANRRLAAEQQRQRDAALDAIYSEGEAALSAIGRLVDRHGKLVPQMVEIAREIVRH